MPLKNLISRLFPLRNTKREHQKAVAELNKFKLVLEQAPGAVFIVDRYMNFEYINPHFEKVSGYSKEELLGKNIKETLYKGKIPDSRIEVIDTLSRGERWQGELLTYNKQGNAYWANTIAAPYKNEQDDVDGYIIIQQDVTERVVMENALKESENLYRTLIEKSLEGVALTQDAKILLVNQTFCNMLGYTVDEMLRMEPPELIAPEDRERVLDYHYKRMRGELDNASYKATFIRKDGSRLLAEMNAASVVINGKFASFVTMRDVTERVHMEKALRESEAKYKTLVENSLEGITIIRDNKILYANNTCCKMLGYTRDELYSMPSVMTLHPDDHEKAFKIAQRRRNMDFSTIYEVFRMVTKNGELRECETTSTMIEYDGQWASFFTSHDITESKRMQDALRRSEEKYRSLIDNATDGIVITQNGLIIFSNPAMCQMLQYNYDEVMGKPYTDYVLPEDHQVMHDYHKRRMAGEIFTSIYRSRFIRKDGKIITVELNARTSDYNGKPAAFLVIRDISDRISMEKAIRESEENYRELVEKTNTIILKWDTKGCITFLNDYGQKFFGFTLDEILCKPVIGTIVPKIEAQTERDLNKMLQDIIQNPEKFEHNINENVKRNGERVWISWNNTPVHDSSGRIIGISSVGTDVTQRVKIEKELQLAKDELEVLNKDLEKRIDESSRKLTEARTQLINLQKENLQSQFEVLRQQVNPHFLFNSLNVLTSLIKLEPDLAEQFSEQLSKVYRYVLENKDNELVDLNTELRFLDAYIFLLNIRFIDKIKVNINIPVNKRLFLIIPLAMQLLIENAIKHNIMTKSEPLIIEIFIDENNYLNIINNLQERPSQLISTGVGLKNIQNRYMLLNNTYPVFEKTETQFIAKVPLVEK